MEVAERRLSNCTALGEEGDAAGDATAGTAAIAANENVELIATIPQCSCEAIFFPWRLDQTLAPNPYRDAFERSIASFIVATRLMMMIGPKVSSLTRVM